MRRGCVCVLHGYVTCECDSTREGRRRRGGGGGREVVAFVCPVWVCKMGCVCV